MVSPLMRDSDIYKKLFSNSFNKLKYDDDDEVSNGVNEKNLWDSITEAYDNERKEYEEYIESKSKNIPLPDEIVKNAVWGYMDKHVFPLLIPVLNSMMFKAQKWEALQGRKSRFNGLDHMAELLWNFNPEYPKRYKNYTDIYDIPFVKQYLKESPRSIFLKSEIWTRNYAALIIQSYYRGHLVRRREDVQQIRQFWKQYNEDASRRLNLVACTLPGSRQNSTRLQCFCDYNTYDCINFNNCELHHALTPELGEELYSEPEMLDSPMF